MDKAHFIEFHPSILDHHHGAKHHTFPWNLLHVPKFRLSRKHQAAAAAENLQGQDDSHDSPIAEEDIVQTSFLEGTQALKNKIPAAALLRKNSQFLLGVLCALGAYIILGSQSVLARYLQNEVRLPKSTINAFAAGTAWCILLPLILGNATIRWLVHRYHRSREAKKLGLSPSKLSVVSGLSSSSSLSQSSLSQSPLGASDEEAPQPHETAVDDDGSSSSKRLMRSRSRILGSILVYGLFSMVYLIRSNMSLRASRYAKATYVQLVFQSNPFLTTMLTLVIGFVASHWCFGKHSNSTQQHHHVHHSRKYKILAIGVAVWLLGAVIGAVSIILGTTSRDPSGAFTWTVKVGNLIEQFTTNDAIGCAYAIATVSLSAVYNVSLNFIMGSGGSKDKKSGFSFYPITGLKLCLVQDTAISIGFFVLAIIFGELDFGPWRAMDATGWAVFAGYTFLVWFASDILFLYAVQLIGSVNVSSTMAIGLLSTMTFSWILNGEAISNLWMIVGAAIVLVCVTGFMVTKRYLASEAEHEQHLEMELAERIKQGKGLNSTPTSPFMSQENLDEMHVEFPGVEHLTSDNVLSFTGTPVTNDDLSREPGQNSPGTKP